MVCENYNLVKEGDLQLVTVSGSLYLGPSALTLLYDGATTSSGVFISGAEFYLEEEFGEAFDLCYVNYYSDELSVNNIKIYYGTVSGTENQVTVSYIDPGQYQATINDSARYVHVQHTVSGTATVYQLEIIGVRNETLGFGTSSGTASDFIYLPHATTDTRSAATNIVPLFNDSHYPEVAKVAITPTLREEDDYLFLSTTPDGTFYGINEFGFTLPGASHLPLHDDNFLSNELDSQWQRLSKAQPHAIVPTQEGLIFDLVHSAMSVEKSMYGTTGLISRESFTAQSFTAEVEIRFLRVDSFIDSGNDTQQERDFFICLTNSYPIPDVGYFAGYMSDHRRGASIGGSTIRGNAVSGPFDIDSARTSMRYVDGTSSDNPLTDDIESRWTDSVFGPEPGEIDNIDGPTLEEILSIVNSGNSLGDFTEGAEWHKWTISYDHIKQELTAFIDKILLGSHIYHVESFKEGCRLFIGVHGNGGVKWELRNFKIFPNKIYRQKNVARDIYGGIASATVSGSHAYKINDGVNSPAYAAPSPTANTHVRIDFDQPYDIVNYRIRQHSVSSSVSAYGQSFHADIARTAIVDFGGVLQEAHLYPPAKVDGFLVGIPEFVQRSPTYSGSAPTVSGISYLDIQFTSYDRTNNLPGALLIDELEIYAEFFVDAPPPEPEDSRKFPWMKGRARNIKQFGIDNTLSIRDLATITTVPSYYPFPEMLVQNVDYGFSSAVNGDQFNEDDDYHHSEALFSAVLSSAAGNYTEWHSAPQGDNNFYIWRYFDERSIVGAVFWSSSTFTHNHVINTFKFQYLVDGGDPNIEEHWINIAPIGVPHPYNTSTVDQRYKNYRDYLIANNDGEYYTNYSLLPHNSTFSVGTALDTGIPTGVIVPTMNGIADTVRTSSSTWYRNGLTGYVQFDDFVQTRAIRMVMKDIVTATALQDPRTQVALSTFHIFRTHAGASFCSPVFDTGTPQNTERIYVDADVPQNTGMSVYIRSTNQPPTHVYNNYEFWEMLGDIGNRDVPISTSACRPTVRTINYNDETYFFFGATSAAGGTDDFAPMIYNYKMDTWRPAPEYPDSGSVDLGLIGSDGTTGVSTTSPTILPDGTVEGNVALIGDTVYLACKDTGELKSPRLARLILTDFTPTWRLFSDFRPPFSEDASMQAFGDRLYFFDKFGSVSYYEIPSNLWVQSSATTPSYGGAGGRNDFCTAIYDSKVYLFGGRVVSDGISNVDVYDIVTDKTYSVSDAPYPMVGHQAITIPEEKCIYLLIRMNEADENDAVMKYFPEEDRWEICESLMWSRDRPSSVASYYSLSAFYYYYNRHIYAIDSSRNMLKANVRKDVWSHGELPDFRDPVWGSTSSFSIVPWVEIESFGELMPQDQYIQFKVEMYSYDYVTSPTVRRISVVTPHEIVVPASGTSNVYIKVGVSDSSRYRMWYTGEFTAKNSSNQNLNDDFSVLYTESFDGFNWEFPVVASGVAYTSNASFAISVMSPCVVKNSLYDYQMWYTRYRVGSSPTDKSIWYVSSYSPRSLSTQATAQQVIADGVVSESSSGAYEPCVLKLSNSSYIIFYTGIDSGGIKRIIRATSSDGISWSSHAVVVTNARDTSNGYDSLGSYRPSVILDGGIYRMWYTGVSGAGIERILYAESSDGITWSFPAVAVDLFSEGIVDTHGCARPWVVKDVDVYYIYYFGYDSSVYHLVRASSPDGLNWASFRIAMPAFGIHSTHDAAGLEDVFVLVDTVPAIPGRYFTGGSLKVYN